MWKYLATAFLSSGATALLVLWNEPKQDKFVPLTDSTAVIEGYKQEVAKLLVRINKTECERDTARRRILQLENKLLGGDPLEEGERIPVPAVPFQIPQK